MWQTKALKTIKIFKYNLEFCAVQLISIKGIDNGLKALKTSTYTKPDFKEISK